MFNTELLITNIKFIFIEKTITVDIRIFKAYYFNYKYKIFIYKCCLFY